VDTREYFIELQLTCLDGGYLSSIVGGATFPEPDDPSADVVSMAGLVTRVPSVPVTKSGRLTIRYSSSLWMKRAHHPILKL
jgi:hypothetical protein